MSKTLVIEILASMQNSRRTAQRAASNRHLKSMGFRMTVDEEAVVANVTTPGLPSSAFDSKTGFATPWQIMKFIGSVRYFAHHDPIEGTDRTFRDYSKMTADRFTFMVSAWFEFKPKLYDFSTPKCPLNVSIESGYVGNTSCNSVATVLTEGGEELFSNTSQVVSIDQSTRRPMPLPDWWKEKYSKKAEQFGPLKYQKSPLPAELVPMKITVMRSDVDGYNHTNWSSYVRFASDAVYHFLKNGSLSRFNDLDRKGLKRMELFYSQESYEGDIVDVYAWEQDDVSEKINVQIYKGTSFLFQTTFEYFEGFMYEKQQ